MFTTEGLTFSAAPVTAPRIGVRNFIVSRCGSPVSGYLSCKVTSRHEL